MEEEAKNDDLKMSKKSPKCPICFEAYWPENQNNQVEEAKNSQEMSVRKTSFEIDLEEFSPDVEDSFMLGILCGHYFHWRCLEKWNDKVCPICRYDQYPPLVQYCEECSSTKNLWSCLICGYIACCTDLKISSHIREHYERTQHNFSVEIETKQIYDFAEDKPVEKLISALINGKLTMTPLEGGGSALKPLSGQINKKMELISLEYEDLMNFQLKS